MRSLRPTLRALSLAVLALTAASAARAAPLALDWADLIPAGTAQAPASARGLVDHTAFAAPGAPTPQEALTAFLGSRPESPPPPPATTIVPVYAGVRTDLEGRDVTLSGYLLPLTFDGMAVTEFLLVPYVGACIHVPPPPANQIVLVAATRGVEIRGLFDAVRVTGRLAVTAVKTDLAEVGYRIDNADVLLVD